MKVSKLVACVLVGSLFLSALALAQAQPPSVPPLGPNVQITIALGGPDAKQSPKTFEMLARDGAPRAEMLIGWRVPIPTERTGEQPGESATSYVYQNVGVTASLQAIVLEGSRILLQGEIEASGSSDGPVALQQGAEMPIVATFQQSIDVIVQEGKPLRVAEVPDPEGGRRYLELSARVQR